MQDATCSFYNANSSPRPGPDAMQPIADATRNVRRFSKCVDWATQAYLKAPNAEQQDYFGKAVAIDGDTIVVGSEDDSSQTTITHGGMIMHNNDAGAAGAAYVFTRVLHWSTQACAKPCPDPD